MAYEQRTVLYEVLARFDDRGVLVGCHRTDVGRMIDLDTGDPIAVTNAGTTVDISAEEAAALIYAPPAAEQHT